MGCRQSGPAWLRTERPALISYPVIRFVVVVVVVVVVVAAVAAAAVVAGVIW